MALTICRECGRAISINADKCPNCGGTVTKYPPLDEYKYILSNLDKYDTFDKQHLDERIKELSNSDEVKHYLKALAIKAKEAAETEKIKVDEANRIREEKAKKENEQGKKIFFGIIAAIVVFMLIVILCTQNSSNNSTNDVYSTESAVDSDTIAAAVEPEEKVVAEWHHSTETDNMRGSTNVWDYIISDNLVDFDFPYDGGSSLRIDIRYMQKYGKDVMLTISKGQFGGSEYQGTNYVTIKFDKSSPRKYYFNEASDGASDCIFLQNKSELIKKFRISHDIIIEAPFFDEGTKQFTFHVDNPYNGTIQ